MLHLRFRIGVYARLRNDSVLTHVRSAFESTRDLTNHACIHTGLLDRPKSYRSPFSSGSSSSNNSPSSMGGVSSNIFAVSPWQSSSALILRKSPVMGGWTDAPEISHSAQAHNSRSQYMKMIIDFISAYQASYAHTMVNIELNYTC